MDLGSGASDLADALLALTAGVPDLHRHPIEDDLTSNSSQRRRDLAFWPPSPEPVGAEGTLGAVAGLLRQRASERAGRRSTGLVVVTASSKRSGSRPHPPGAKPRLNENLWPMRCTRP
jgi:hypothetical protein